ncbi:VOC family protein [Acinetobacter shaoyimingii]|uniref:Uncharacterized protein n=1 Tax=Acinetobacter shaoyimingii TaxID=2715164 RepID=A0A6G8RXD2_9GAMM|nr:hypothetical protein [Acinetobacter shaoyimingii]QIO06557.1 hypothetical protein G8E00_11630 [Acinetobacter shaoyimingii]
MNPILQVDCIVANLPAIDLDQTHYFMPYWVLLVSINLQSKVWMILKQWSL